MKKGTKDNIGCIIATVSIFAVIAGLSWWAISTFTSPDKDKMGKFFERDKIELILVTDYFIDSEYPVISIKSSDGFMYVGHNKKIEDEAVIKAIKRLFKKRGYKAIGKESNTIYFEKWGLGEDRHGIAYSINGEDEPVLQFLVKLEPLSEAGWYYYNDNYKKYRNR